MGGQRQDTIGDLPEKAISKGGGGGGGGGVGVIQAPAAKVSPAATSSLQNISAGSQKIRFHENKGEVHFHADDDGLKVALPVAEWYAAWDRLKNLRETEFSYFDPNRCTKLTVQVGMIGDKVDARASVEQLADSIGDTFGALDQFTVPRKKK